MAATARVVLLGYLRDHIHLEFGSLVCEFGLPSRVVWSLVQNAGAGGVKHIGNAEFWRGRAVIIVSEIRIGLTWICSFIL